MPKLLKKMNDVSICIPSKGRAQNILNHARFCTANWISEKMWSKTTYYVEPEESEAYFRVLPEGCGLEETVQGVGNQWSKIMDRIIEDCQTTTLIIMDDDLKLDVRPCLPDEPTTFVPMDDVWFNRMVIELSYLATMHCPLVSAQYRQFCQGHVDQFKHNQRISMIWCLHMPFFRKNTEFRFFAGSNLVYMADYHFFMNLLTHGHPNLCINRFVKDDKPNAPGGIQAGKNLELFNSNVQQFADMYPDWVSVYSKAGKSHWQDGALGVRIKAARAYAANSRKAVTK